MHRNLSFVGAEIRLETKGDFGVRAPRHRSDSTLSFLLRPFFFNPGTFPGFTSVAILSFWTFVLPGEPLSNLNFKSALLIKRTIIMIIMILLLWQNHCWFGPFYKIQYVSSLVVRLWLNVGRGQTKNCFQDVHSWIFQTGKLTALTITNS